MAVTAMPEIRAGIVTGVLACRAAKAYRVRTPSQEAPMHDKEKRDAAGYPIGRGYGHDYMRGGEVFGGYGYSARPEYEKRRGDADLDETPKESDQGMTS